MGVVDPLPAVLRVAPFAGSVAAGFVRRPAPVTLGVRRNVWQAPSSAFSRAFPNGEHFPPFSASKAAPPLDKS